MEGNFESHIIFLHQGETQISISTGNSFLPNAIPYLLSAQTPTPLASSFSCHKLSPLRALIRKPQEEIFDEITLMNYMSQLLQHSSHHFVVCVRNELSTQDFKIHFVQNGVWAFKGGVGTEIWLVQQVKPEIMLKEYSFILYNAKDEDVNGNRLWTFLCTEWNT